jgi:hypothetical protein
VCYHCVLKELTRNNFSAVFCEECFRPISCVKLAILQKFFCSATVHLGPRPFRFDVSRLHAIKKHTHAHAHTHTHTHTHTDAPCRTLPPTQQTTNTKTNIHALSRIRTGGPSNQAAGNLPLRLHSHRNRHLSH